MDQLCNHYPLKQKEGMSSETIPFLESPRLRTNGQGHGHLNLNCSNPHQSLEEPAESRQFAYWKESVKHGAARTDSASHYGNLIKNVHEESKEVSGRGYKSENLLAEKQRRDKLLDRLYTLRSLIPRITKMDRASILKDAIDFIKELRQTAKDLQDELEEAPEEDGPDGTGYESNGTKKSTSIDHRTESIFADDSSSTDNKEHRMEPQVEVTSVGEKEFFLKVLCEHKPWGFVKLMEALNTLGLEVTKTKVTTSEGLVLNAFRVEKGESEAVQADQIRDFLLEVIRSPIGTQLENGRATENGIKEGQNSHHMHHLRHQFIELKL